MDNQISSGDGTKRRPGKPKIPEGGEPFMSFSNYLSEDQLNESVTETILCVRGLIGIQEGTGMPPLLSFGCCICRIPPTLVKEKPDAYIPHLISIGPFHRNQTHLQFMESQKKLYLGRFFPISPEPDVALDSYIEAMIKIEEKARGCYQEEGKGELEIDKNRYVMMLVVDGCFILELLLSKDHQIMLGKKWGFLVSLDLLLLENQLPFCVLEELYRVFMANPVVEAPISSAPTDEARWETTLDWLIGHSYVGRILELLVGKNACNYSTRIKRMTKFRRPNHLLDFLRLILIPWSSERPGNSQEQDNDHVVRIGCATDLQRANVKIVKNNYPRHLLDIYFDNNEGVLAIPGLRIDSGTEMIIRNLIAYEQYTDDYSSITEYAAFLDGLIDSSKDVELLQKSGIIEIIVGDPNDVSRLFSNLHKDVAVNFYFTVPVLREVELYCKKNQNKWMATLKLDYFNSPWVFISVVATVILLCLAVGQTVYTILSYYHRWTIVQTSIREM